MARIRREFIQLDQRLFNDPRFYMLDEFGQLTYIKLVSLAKQTGNKIPKDLKAICLYFKTNRNSTELETAINQVKEIFDNFKENRYFYYFDNFDLRYRQNGKNYGEEEKEYKEEYKEEYKNKPQASPALNAAFDKVYKQGLNIYALLNRLKKESKVGVEVPEEILLKVCACFEKNKVDIKDSWPWFIKAIIAEWQSWNAEQNIRQGREYKKQDITSALKEILAGIGAGKGNNAFTRSLRR